MSDTLRIIISLALLGILFWTLADGGGDPRKGGDDNTPPSGL